MEENRSRSYSTAGLGDNPSIVQDQAHGFADLIFAYGHDIVYELHDMREGNFSYRRGAQPIGKGGSYLLGRECHPLLLAQAGLGIASQLRFNSHNFYLRVHLFYSGSNSADEPASAYGSQNQLYIGQVFHYFQTYCALAGNDFFIILGRHEHKAVLRFQLCCLVDAVTPVRSYNYHLRPVSFGCFELDIRDIVWQALLFLFRLVAKLPL